jgi:hypothetical protein
MEISAQTAAAQPAAEKASSMEPFGAQRAPARSILAMPRNEYFAALFIVGCVNGIGSRVIETIRASGWQEAVLTTFSMSAVVWIACYVGIHLVVEEGSEKVRPTDILVGLILLIPIAVPIGGLSWLALSVLSIYVILFSAPSSARRRGAIILFATTVPMLWSGLLFRYFANFILGIDASLVGLLLGTPSNGNVVPFADGSGSLVILPYCSSMANVSVAFLAWILVSRWEPRHWSPRDVFCCLVAAAAVVSVNVTRISLMGLSQWHYSAIHSQWGDLITNLLICGLTLGISLLGVRRETNPRV